MPRTVISENETRIVLEEYARNPAGIVRMKKQLQASNPEISYHRTYRIMAQEGITVQSKNKSKRRKWVLYERRHSDAMWHTDWHMMKNPLLEEVNLIAYLGIRISVCDGIWTVQRGNI